jgi:hypothetical protein
LQQIAGAFAPKWSLNLRMIGAFVVAVQQIETEPNARHHSTAQPFDKKNRPEAAWVGAVAP